MDRYNRVWRDPKSPLTPITPIASQVFNFGAMATLPMSPERTPPAVAVNSFRGLKASHLAVPQRRSAAAGQLTGRHFSKDFMRIRSVFSPNGQSTTIRSDITPRRANILEHENRKFKRASPVEQPTLSPRVRSLLSRTGNDHLTDLFTRQEIDIQVLIQMTLEDLESLGIQGAKELKLAIDVIKFAKKFF